MLQSLAMIAANTAPTPAVRSLKRPLDLTPWVEPSPSEARGRVPFWVSKVNLPEYPLRNSSEPMMATSRMTPAMITMSWASIGATYFKPLKREPRP